MQLLEWLGSQRETLLLVLVILLQIVLIFLVLQRKPLLVREGVAVGKQSRWVKGTVEPERESPENLWENPPPTSEEMKLAISEFKHKYNRNDPWDGDFVL